MPSSYLGKSCARRIILWNSGLHAAESAITGRLREFSAKHAGTAQENQAIVVPGIDPTLWLSGLASWRTHTQQRNGGGRASGGILAQHFMSDLKQAGRLRFRNQRRYTYGMRFLRRQHVAESTEKNDRNAGHLQV